MWRCICETCAHQWLTRLPALDDPDSLGVVCEACEGEIITAVLVAA